MVAVTQCLYDGVGDLEARRALLEALAAMVVASLLPEVGDEVRSVLLYGDGVGGGVFSDTDALEVRWVVDGVTTPLAVSARVPTSLGDPVDGS